MCRERAFPNIPEHSGGLVPLSPVGMGYAGLNFHVEKEKPPASLGTGAVVTPSQIQALSLSGSTISSFILIVTTGNFSSKPFRNGSLQSQAEKEGYCQRR